MDEEPSIAAEVVGVEDEGRTIRDAVLKLAQEGSAKGVGCTKFPDGDGSEGGDDNEQEVSRWRVSVERGGKSRYGELMDRGDRK